MYHVPLGILDRGLAAASRHRRHRRCHSAPIPKIADHPATMRRGNKLA